MHAVLVEFEPYGPWDIERNTLTQLGGTLEVMSPPAFTTRRPDCDLVLNVAAAPVSAEMLAAMPNIRCVVSYGIGTDWIDLGEADRRQIMVVNMPFANVEEVATHSVALILACARRLVDQDRAIRGGEFDWPRSKPIYRLSGRRLGLLAFGSIPRRVVQIIRPLGIRVAAHDPYVEPHIFREQDVEQLDLEELFATSDILSVHVPSTNATRSLVNERLLGLLPPGALVVITSRGDVYDADALVSAVSRGQVAAAGLDVFPEEPLPLTHPLLRTPNVILTPHSAGYSEQSIEDLHQTAGTIIEALARGETPPGLLNLRSHA
jgi:D-3-phosphoglycerate dehydrogenase